jgi:hypothetical protein
LNTALSPDSYGLAAVPGESESGKKQETEFLIMDNGLSAG